MSDYNNVLVAQLLNPEPIGMDYFLTEAAGQDLFLCGNPQKAYMQVQKMKEIKRLLILMAIRSSNKEYLNYPVDLLNLITSYII